MWQAVAAVASLAASGVAAAGQAAAGRAAEEEAKLTAFNIGTEKEMNKIQAMQAAQARREEYDLATSTNIAAFAAMGRDIGSDRSVQAFLERQKEILGQDVGRIQQQAQFQNLSADMRASIERLRGANERRAANIRAAGTLIKGVSAYAQTRY
jgi:hypothetical protein